MAVFETDPQSPATRELEALTTETLHFFAKQAA